MIPVYDFHIRACINIRYLGMVMTGQVVLTRADACGTGEHDGPRQAQLT